MTITPLVNLNGTDAATLIEQQCAIISACDQLLRVLHHAMPHGRDYHLKLGPENHTELARRAHQERIKSVQAIMKDAEVIALSVQEQAGK
jgi:hypothetical protein